MDKFLKSMKIFSLRNKQAYNNAPKNFIHTISIERNKMNSALAMREKGNTYNSISRLMESVPPASRPQSLTAVGAELV